MDFLLLLASFLLFTAIVFLVQKKIGNYRRETEEVPENKIIEKIVDNTSIDKLEERIYSLTNRIAELEKTISDQKSKYKGLKEINIELSREKEKLKLQLRKTGGLKKRKEELLQIYLHDLKKPASTIKNLAELLNSYDNLVDEQQTIVETILIAAEKLVSLSNQITKDLEDDANGDYKEKTSIKQLLHDSYLCHLVNARKKGQSILINIDENIPLIKIDPTKINQVIDNVISNAIKFSPADSIIELNAFTGNKNIIVEIIDQGPGFTNDDLNKMFEKGATLSARPTSGEESSGFGLWIVKKLVEEHAGTVFVNNHGDKGTKFSFTLPIS